jgi:hypothetical protein
MANKGAMGLILDRVQLCEQMGVSDSALTAWEKKGMPTVRKGRGRGMKSLYDLAEVRAWCDRTGYGHSLQALVASFSRTEPPPAAAAPPPAVVQTSGRARLTPEDDEALRFHSALEVAFICLPGLLARAGMADGAIDGILQALFDEMRRELVARGEPAHFIDRELDAMRTTVDDERGHPGMWTAWTATD